MNFTIRPALTEKQTAGISTFIAGILAKEIATDPKLIGNEQVYRINLEGMGFSYEALIACPAFGAVKDELRAKGWHYRKRPEKMDDGYSTYTINYLEIFAPL